MVDKLPIPRLPHEKRNISGRRISRACDACRERKTKCDGNRPRCTQCTAQGFEICVFSEGKIERLQKELQTEKKRAETYEKFLQDLSVECEGPIADRIRRVLKKKSLTGVPKHRRKGSNTSSSSSMGSLEDVDVASEDFNRNEKSRATGYMGKSSEVVWMQRLGIEARRQNDDNALEPTSPLRDVPDDSLSSTNYHLDERSLKIPAVPNAFVLPPKALSDKLLMIYFDKVQISLPFIRKELFCAQYHRCFQGGVNPGGKWLAILNLVLAIGSAIARLSGEGLSSGDDEDMFFARAKSLSASEHILYQHDDLQQVQIELLIAFFFLTVSQINRSWKFIGIAARSGISLGINLHKKNNEVDAQSEEVRKQLWWSIFRLEHLLSVMTGRISCIAAASSSLPPPLPLPSLVHTGSAGKQTGDDTSLQLDQLHWTMFTTVEDMDLQRKILDSFSPSPSLYHFYMVDLSLIARTISSGIYSTQIHRTDWGRIESLISLYNKRMDQWTYRLNAAFHFQDKQGNLLSTIDSPFQMSLALSYYSTRIVLNRPCLNRPAFEKLTGARLARSRFSNLSALTCLRASMSIITLLPDQASLSWAYQLPQWWDIVHVLTQATVILLLDISIGPVPTKPGQSHVVPESVEDVLEAAKKGIHWLQCLGATSGSAQRSFEFATRCVHRLTAARVFDLSDIPPVAHQPYTGRNTREKGDSRSKQGNSSGHDAKKLMPEDFTSTEKSNSEKIVQNQAGEDRQQTLLSLYDRDVDMPDTSPDLPDSEFEELLLSMTAS